MLTETISPLMSRKDAQSSAASRIKKKKIQVRFSGRVQQDSIP
jgi:hypothetical protein